MKGLRGAPGIAIGPVVVFEETGSASSEPEAVSGPRCPDEEWERYLLAVDRTRAGIEKLHRQTEKSAGEQAAGIFEAHLEMLTDPELTAKIRTGIFEEQGSAEHAIGSVFDSYERMFEQMPDAYFRERALDVRDIRRQLLLNLRSDDPVDQRTWQDPSIVVARELTPSVTMSFDRTKLLGLVVEEGGSTSHVAILAASLGIPAVVGAAGAREQARGADQAIVDGSQGIVLFDPPEDTIQMYENRAREDEIRNEAIVRQQSRTADGLSFSLHANITTADEIHDALRLGAQGVGLMRTEFLFMRHDREPDEETQFQAYREAAQRLQGKPLIIRTLDVGGDKEIPYLAFERELNPFLGYRAIRYCLDHPDLFMRQLRALMRAAACGDVRIMLPMISTLEEVERTRALMAQAAKTLSEQNERFNPRPPLGIMVEIPAAAVMADVFARHVDFFSIGTNDLMQYVLAADRTNERVSASCSQFHPAVLRLIRQTVRAADEAHIPVGMCGEMASNPRLLPLLRAMGLTQFSMQSHALPAAKQALIATDCSILTERMDALLAQERPEKIERDIAELTSVQD